MESRETKSDERSAVDPLMMAIRYNMTKGVVQLLLQRTKLEAKGGTYQTNFEKARCVIVITRNFRK